MDTSTSVARLSDARAIAALRTSVAQDMTRRYGAGHWSACPGKAEVVRQLRATRVLVARRDDEIIGTVRLTAAKPWAIDASCFSPAKSVLYVLGLAVAPGARQQGIGRQLMEAAKHIARSLDAGALWLDAYDNPAGAGSFYLACGFRAVGRTRHREVPLIYYEWLA